MNFSLDLSGSVITGNINPEVFSNLGSFFGMFLGGMFIVWIIIWIAVMVFMLISRWRVFEKAGFPGWGILIPFYNMYLMFKLGGRSGWNFLWILLPPVFAILMIINYFKIAVRFGKPSIYGLGIRLVGIVFIPILAFDKSKYIPLKKK
ncbi:MAG: DUF5684 domain-containing protein [Candidatus Absconditabacterales bacterium]|jgi:hypothetical protein